MAAMWVTIRQFGVLSSTFFPLPTNILNQPLRRALPAPPAHLLVVLRPSLSRPLQDGPSLAGGSVRFPPRAFWFIAWFRPAHGRLRQRFDGWRQTSALDHLPNARQAVCEVCG